MISVGFAMKDIVSIADITDIIVTMRSFFGRLVLNAATVRPPIIVDKQ